MLTTERRSARARACEVISSATAARPAPRSSSTTTPSSADTTVSTTRAPKRSIRRPTPRQKSAPTSVAHRLIWRRGRGRSEVSEQRLGDESEPCVLPAACRPSPRGHGHVHPRIERQGEGGGRRAASPAGSEFTRYSPPRTRAAPPPSREEVVGAASHHARHKRGTGKPRPASEPCLRRSGVEMIKIKNPCHATPEAAGGGGRSQAPPHHQER